MNKIILMGRLTADPKLESIKDSMLCKINIAVTRQHNKEKTDFINCIAWGKRGETIAQYFRKGNKILIEGELYIEQVKMVEETKYYTTVNISNFEFVESKNSNNKQEIKVMIEQDDPEFPF